MDRTKRMEKTFETLVKAHFDSLSAGKKIVAEYLLNNLDQASYLTLAQIGRETNVSETTVIRLAYSLGFNGFSDMQKKIQSQVLHSASMVGEKEEGKTDDPFEVIIENDIQIIKQMYQKLNKYNFQQAIEMVAEADKILIVGHRTAYAAASWLAATLGILRDNVYMLQSTGVQELLSVTERTVVIAISFPRYMKDTYNLTLNAKEQGAKVIAVTDHELSPIGVISTVTILSNTNRDESGYNSISPVMSLLNLLAAGLRMREQSKVHDRLQRLEKLYNYDSLFE